jgi:signal transduction histidine kinase
MRLLMFELRPDALESASLADLLQHSIEALECRGDLQVERQLTRNDNLPPSTRVQLYRIAQEALSNVARHSGASKVGVEWMVDSAQRATLRIADNGRGFDPQERRAGHFGLDNMRSRAQEIGAAFLLTTAPGQGTELKIEVA